MADYNNKIIIITGATSGIGKAISEKLKKLNAKLILLGRDFSKVGDLLQEDENCRHYVVDLKDHQKIMGFVNSVKNEFNKIDYLIHSAGVITVGNMNDIEIADLDHHYLVNCRAPYLLTQQLMPHIKAAKGTVVFLNSTAGLQTWKGMGQYSAGKYALKAIADSLRLELADDNVNILSVYPEATSTPMQEYIQKVNGKKYNPEMFLSSEDVAGRIISVMSSIGRAGVTDLTIRAV